MDLLGDENEHKLINEIVAGGKQKLMGINQPWVDKHRPKTIQDIILPESIKSQVEFSLQTYDFPNMIFHSGKPGTGKTTLARLIPEILNTDYMFCPIATRSMEYLEQIQRFSMQKSYDGKPRFVILDEADRPSERERFYQGLQPLIEDTSGTIRFILTLNNIYIVPEAMRSRCIPISFAHKEDKTMMNTMYKRLTEISVLETGDKNKVNKDTIIDVLKFHYPDMRAMINTLHLNYLQNRGSIDGVPTYIDSSYCDKIWNFLREGKYVELRKFVTEYITDFIPLYPLLGNYIIDKIDPKHRLNFAIVLGESQYRASIPAIDQEININSFFARVIQIIHGK